MADTKINSAGEQQPIDKLQRYASMSTSALRNRQTIDLSKSEWKRYFDVIGDIRSGTVQEHNVNGGRWVILNTNEESDGTRTPARLILDNGKYISKKNKKIERIKVYLCYFLLYLFFVYWERLYFLYHIKYQQKCLIQQFKT